MNLDIRSHIINNFKGDDINTLKEAIEESIKNNDEITLPGMGNEGNGVSSDILELCDTYLCIEMNHEVESLNVAIATSILLYELSR